MTPSLEEIINHIFEIIVGVFGAIVISLTYLIDLILSFLPIILIIWIVVVLVGH